MLRQLSVKENSHADMASNKRTLTAVIMVVLLSGISFWILQHNREGTIRKELFDFAVEDTSSITKIFMVNMNGKKVTLEKIKPGYWEVNEKYKARIDAIKNLLVCIKELEVKNPVAKSAVETISKQLATNSTKVEIYQNDRLTKTYYVGGDTQDGDGTYMLLSDPETGENSTMPFVMFIPGFNGFLSVRYFIEEEIWRDRSIFSFYPDQISSISVEYTQHPDSGFSISISDDFKISMADRRGKQFSYFDTLKAKQYVSYYSNIQFEALVTEIRPTLKDSVLSKPPVHIVKLKDREGKIHTVKTYSKPILSAEIIDEATGQKRTEDLDRMYALINDDKDFVLIQYYAFGKLFQVPQYFTTPSSLDQAVGVKK